MIKDPIRAAALFVCVLGAAWGAGCGGGNSTVVQNDPFANVLAERIPGGTGCDQRYFPRISPNGSSVAYTCGNAPPAVFASRATQASSREAAITPPMPQSRIRVVELDGSREIEIPCELPDEDHRAFMPDWSPDGHRVVFASSSELYIAYSFSSTTSCLTIYSFTSGTFSRLQGVSPQWTADGENIIFIDGQGTMGHLGLFSGDYAALSGDTCRNPALSPDGQRIAAVCTKDNDEYLTLMQADGTGIEYAMTFRNSGAWGPDNATLALPWENKIRFYNTDTGVVGELDLGFPAGVSITNLDWGGALGKTLVFSAGGDLWKYDLKQ